MKNLVCSLLVFLQVVVSERVDLDGVCADQNLLAMEFFHLTEHHEEEAIIYDMRKGKYRVKKKLNNRNVNCKKYLAFIFSAARR